MVGFWNTVLCMAWPWHKLAIIERLSEQADHLRCKRCGRECAVNYDVRALLPWETVRGFYAERRQRECA